MRTLLVVHELQNPDENHAGLSDKLKSYTEWWHCLDSTWLVKADLTARELADALVPLVGMEDLLLVIDVSGRAAAWTEAFPPDCQSWLRKKI
jgi:hypothetical protein